MTIAQNPMVIPLLVQIGLTLLVFMRLGVTRSLHIRAVGFPAVLREGFPPKIEQTSANLKHQFEAPTLFYVITLLYLLGLETTVASLVFASLYVALRIIHAGIQLTHNIIFPWRFGTFILSMMALVGLYVAAIIQIVMS